MGPDTASLMRPFRSTTANSLSICVDMRLDERIITLSMEVLRMNQYRLGIPPLTLILPDLVFDTRKEAAERAREENRTGDYKGRGVKVYKVDDSGRMA